MEERNDIDYKWLNEMAENYDGLNFNYDQSNEKDIQSAEKNLNWKFPSDYRNFLIQFNGIEDLDGIKILSPKEIINEMKDELFDSQLPFKIIPMAKYLYEYSYLVSDESGSIFKLEHDNDKLRMKYPDFWSFILLQSLFYIEDPFIYEEMNLSNAEIDRKIEHHRSVIVEKLKLRNFDFDNFLIPDWSNWKKGIS